MLSYMDFLVRQEQYKELLREAEHGRLIRVAALRQPSRQRLRRKVADWVGVQMVSWGRKLQQYGSAPPSRCLQVAECQ